MYRPFGPYWLLRRIGLGDLAEVFVATRTDPNGEDEKPAGAMELVAVKRISREMSNYDEVHELFAREGRLAARFDHPKVVRVTDVGDVGGRPYIAMEYIPGADLAHLRDRIHPAILPPGPAIRVILDMCEALDYVHNATDDAGRALEVVHGDMTPTNILVSTGGVAKLIDFSVASSGDTDRGDTTVRGTYAYMSPEQVRGRPIDRRTDVFALGVVLWELLAGRRLFRRRANYLTLAAVVEDEVPGLAEVDVDLGRGQARLDEILTRALAKNADDRYSTVTELAADLEPVARDMDWDLRPWTLQTAVRELLSEPQSGRPRRATESGDGAKKIL